MTLVAASDEGGRMVSIKHPIDSRLIPYMPTTSAREALPALKRAAVVFAEHPVDTR